MECGVAVSCMPDLDAAAARARGFVCVSSACCHDLGPVVHGLGRSRP